MKKKILIIAAVILLLLGIGVGIYIGDYYHADEYAIKCMNEGSDNIIITEKKGNYVFMPDNIVAGVIFYPGGKVEAKSYAPLMRKLADNDIMSILVTMPANLAVFGINKADGLVSEYPNVSKWYMAGHSLGGSMAASYLAKNADEYEGIILLAAYSTESLKDKDLGVLSIYGDCDKVLNMDSYEKNIKNLPEGYEELVI